MTYRVVCHYTNGNSHSIEPNTHLLLPRVSLWCIPPLLNVLSLLVLGNAEEYPGIVKVFVDSSFSLLLLLGSKVLSSDILRFSFWVISKSEIENLTFATP